ncbi:MAG: site-2 protease family protein [Clostridia bacterium]|nr:site-2 protease family protein [Clostridia bacterium]
MTALYIVLAIILFGLIIAMHEFGHFFAARLFGVTVREFAIGMGPKILSKKSKKSGVTYSLRLFPIGGFCDMGEDVTEESEKRELEKLGMEKKPESEYSVAGDPNHFSKKPVWQRILILLAGSLTNIIAGFLVMLILTAATPALYSNTVDGFAENASSYKTGLRTGDKIVGIAGHGTHIANDVVYRIVMDCTEPVDIVVIRDGEKITLENVTFGTEEEEGLVIGVRDFNLAETEKSLGTVLKHSFFHSKMTVDMVFDSIKGLITGRFGFKDLSGPVGVTSAITTAAKSGVYDVVYLFIIIAINIGIMNLLPIPALDGGRVMFRLIELFTKKRVKPEIEGYIHLGGMALLLLLMIVVSVKDVINLF